MNQKYLETWKQDGSWSVPSRRTIQVLKEKEIELISKKSEEKEKKGVKKKNVIDTLCECNINTFAEEHFSSEST